MSVTVRKKAIRAAALAAAAILTGSVAAADPVSFSGVSQTASAQDDAPNSNMHTRFGFGPNSAMVEDGDSFVGYGNASASQAISYPGASSRVLNATAQVSAMAIGPIFGGDYAATASADFNAPFTLARAQDIIYTESPFGSSALMDSVGNIILPGTSLLQRGSYTLSGGDFEAADGVDGASDSNRGGYNISIQFITPGDANQDGTVNFADVLALIQHYGHTNATLADGDFNNDGTIDFPDVLALIQNYGASDAASVAAAPAPEPAGGLVTIAISALALRRHKQK